MTQVVLQVPELRDSPGPNLGGLLRRRLSLAVKPLPGLRPSGSRELLGHSPAEAQRHDIPIADDEWIPPPLRAPERLRPALEMLTSPRPVRRGEILFGPAGGGARVRGGGGAPAHNVGRASR